MNITRWLTPHHRLIMLLLSLMGAVITQTYPKSCLYFWMAMLLALGLLSIAPDYWQRSSTNTAWISSALHWAGTAFGVVVVFAYRRSGRLYDEKTG